MKPDWKEAPEWANWKYLSITGQPIWAEVKPRWSWLYGDYEHMGAYAFAAKPFFTHYPASRAAIKQSLTQRPDTTKPAEAGSEGQGA